jgi:hypothetical protein
VTAATQTSSLEAVMTPASLSATIFSERSPTRATATPTFPAASETTLLSSVPAPALAPLPTPPEPDI